MLMRPQKTETAVQSCLIPARVIRFCACARWWPHHGAGVMPLWHLSFLVFLWVHWTLQNTGTNRDHFRLNKLSQMENTTSLFTLAVTTSCPWYMCTALTGCTSVFLLNDAQLAGTTGVCWEFAVQRARHTRKENMYFFPLPSRVPLIASQIPMNAQSKINASHQIL